MDKSVEGKEIAIAVRSIIAFSNKPDEPNACFIFCNGGHYFEINKNFDELCEVLKEE